MDIEERARQISEEEKANSFVPSTTTCTFQEKALTEVNFDDVKFKLDTSKDFEKQVEDVLGGVVTASAVQDTGVQKDLKEKKAEELLNKAKTKASDAQKHAIEAETEVQKAERDLYEAVLNTFGIYKHLPPLLMKVLVFIFSPLFILINLIIGVPCGFCKIIIDNLDGIICRYDKTGDIVKPKIKIIFWILLALSIVGAVCLTVLKCLNKI